MYSDFGPLADPPCGYLLPRLGDVLDSPGGHEGIPHSKSNAFSTPLTAESAARAGKRLGVQDVVSLAFLIMKDEKRALKLCQAVVSRQDQFSSSPGSMFLASLVSYGAKQDAQNLQVAIACALHLLKKYQTLKALVSLDKTEAVDKFSEREYLYLDDLRVDLFKVAFDLNANKRKALMEALAADLGCQLRSTTSDFCLEIALLEMLVYWRHHLGRLPQRLLPEIGKHLDRQEPRLKKHLTTKRPSLFGSGRDNVLKRGLCIVFNQRNYHRDVRSPQAKEFPERRGTEKDRERLEKLWKRFGCDVRIYDNSSDRDIVAVVNELTSKDASFFAPLDFFVLCLLGHGDRSKDRDVFYGANGLPVPIEENIVRPFTRVRHLQGKLQLFLIQACRGPTPVPTITHDGNTLQRPMGSDWIKFFSTLAGYAAYLNTKEGSFFIQLFCDEMETFGRFLSLQQILTRVQENIKKNVGRQAAVTESAYSKEAFFEDTWMSCEE